MSRWQGIFVLNNPVNATDPLGLQCDGDNCGGGDDGYGEGSGASCNGDADCGWSERWEDVKRFFSKKLPDAWDDFWGGGPAAKGNAQIVDATAQGRHDTIGAAPETCSMCSYTDRASGKEREAPWARLDATSDDWVHYTGHEALNGVEYGTGLAGIGAIRNVSARALLSTVRWKAFSKGSLAAHFAKHGAEYGSVTQSQYLKLAKTFASETGEFLEEQVGNFLIKYDPATGRRLVGHIESREIRTFYKTVADGTADAFHSAVELARKLSAP